jgi:hypothetical protein
MKMVKRMLIAIAVLAFVATSVQALDYPSDDPNYTGPDATIKRDDSWPTEYIALELCDIPVLMDVGMYVQVKECDKRKIVLKQVTCTSIGKGKDDFPCYEGCDSDVEVRANFAAVLSTKLTKAEGSPIKDWEASIDDPLIPGDGVYKKVTVCVKAWKTEIWNAGPGDEVKVGTVTLMVKPQ